MPDEANLANHPDQASWLQVVEQGAHYVKRAGQAVIIGAELTLVNEALRYGTLAWALSNYSGGAALGAMALGGSTLVVEGLAAVTTADVITTDRATALLEKVNDRVGKIIPKSANLEPKDLKMNMPIEAGVALMGGSVVVLAEKQREDPSRTKRQNTRHGVFTAAWMSAYFGVEGAYIGANSQEHGFVDVRTAGAFLLSLGVTAIGAKMALKRTANNQPNQSHEEGVE